MLDERKVKVMTKLAFYEQTQGKEDFKISEYYRKDYAGLHMVFSVFWSTIGYVLALLLAVLAGLDALIESMTVALMITLASGVVIGYLIVVIVYVIITGCVYNKRHKDARQRVKQYNHNLTILLKMYEKEKK